MRVHVCHASYPIMFSSACKIRKIKNADDQMCFSHTHRHTHRHSYFIIFSHIYIYIYISYLCDKVGLTFCLKTQLYLAQTFIILWNEYQQSKSKSNNSQTKAYTLMKTTSQYCFLYKTVFLTHSPKNQHD